MLRGGDGGGGKRGGPEGWLKRAAIRGRGRLRSAGPGPPTWRRASALERGKDQAPRHAGRLEPAHMGLFRTAGWSRPTWTCSGAFRTRFTRAGEDPGPPRAALGPRREISRCRSPNSLAKAPISSKAQSGQSPSHLAKGLISSKPQSGQGPNPVKAPIWSLALFHASLFPSSPSLPPYFPACLPAFLPPSVPPFLSTPAPLRFRPPSLSFQSLSSSLSLSLPPPLPLCPCLFPPPP